MCWRRLLTLFPCCVALIGLLIVDAAMAQHSTPLHQDSPHMGSHDGHVLAPSAEAWEGSARGIAYSEQNHHIAGLLVILMGLAELSHVLRLSSLSWARLLLPS